MLRSWDIYGTLESWLTLGGSSILIERLEKAGFGVKIGGWQFFIIPAVQIVNSRLGNTFFSNLHTVNLKFLPAHVGMYMFERNFIMNSGHKIQAVYKNMEIIILDVLYYPLSSPWP